MVKYRAQALYGASPDGSFCASHPAVPGSKHQIFTCYASKWLDYGARSNLSGTLICIFQQEADKKSPCNFPRASALVTARASTQLEPKISNFAPEIKLTGRTIFASSPVGLIEDDVFDAGQPQTHLDAEMHESTRSSDHDCLKWDQKVWSKFARIL